MIRGFVELAEALRTRTALRACSSVGVGARLRGLPRIENPGRMVLGDRLVVESEPVQTHLVTGPLGSLLIGSDVHISHGAGVVALRQVRIGDGTIIGSFTMIMDTDFHDVVHRDRDSEPLPIEIGRRVRLGSHVTVLRGSTIGDDVVVEAGSVVSGVVPPGCVVSGVPARVVKSPGGSAAAPMGSDSGSVEDRVRAAIALTFNLTQLPSPEDARESVPGWDSLGALKLLLALEETFSVSLSEDDVARAARVADLSAAVQRARDHSSEARARG